MQYTNEQRQEIFEERTKKDYPQIWAYYEELLENEALSKEELDALNFRRRKEIAVYAYERSPFYRTLYDKNGFDPHSLETEADWDSVPVVTKDMVRDFSDQIQVPGEIEKWGRANNTGGSTGKPLKVFNDKRDAVPAVYWRYRGWWQNGVRGGYRSIV